MSEKIKTIGVPEEHEAPRRRLDIQSITIPSIDGSSVVIPVMPEQDIDGAERN